MARLFFIFGIDPASAKFGITRLYMSGINLTDKQQQTSQLSNSASARNVIEMNGMEYGYWKLDTVMSEILNSLDK